MTIMQPNNKVGKISKKLKKIIKDNGGEIILIPAMSEAIGTKDH